MPDIDVSKIVKSSASITIKTGEQTVIEDSGLIATMGINLKDFPEEGKQKCEAFFTGTPTVIEVGIMLREIDKLAHNLISQLMKNAHPEELMMLFAVLSSAEKAGIQEVGEVEVTSIFSDLVRRN